MYFCYIILCISILGSFFCCCTHSTMQRCPLFHPCVRPFFDHKILYYRFSVSVSIRFLCNKKPPYGRALSIRRFSGKRQYHFKNDSDIFIVSKADSFAISNIEFHYFIESIISAFFKIHM